MRPQLLLSRCALPDTLARSLVTLARIIVTIGSFLLLPSTSRSVSHSIRSVAEWQKAWLLPLFPYYWWPKQSPTIPVQLHLITHCCWECYRILFSSFSELTSAEDEGVDGRNRRFKTIAIKWILLRLSFSGCLTYNCILLRRGRHFVRVPFAVRIVYSVHGCVL